MEIYWQTGCHHIRHPKSFHINIFSHQLLHLNRKIKNCLRYLRAQNNKGHEGGLYFQVDILKTKLF